MGVPECSRHKAPEKFGCSYVAFTPICISIQKVELRAEVINAPKTGIEAPSIAKEEPTTICPCIILLYSLHLPSTTGILNRQRLNTLFRAQC